MRIEHPKMNLRAPCNPSDDARSRWESEVLGKASAEAALQAQVIGKVTSQQPFFAELGQRLENLSAILDEADGAIAMLRSRVLGPWPCHTRPDIDGDEPRVNLRDAALEMVEALIQRARVLADHGHVLNTSL